MENNQLVGADIKIAQMPAITSNLHTLKKQVAAYLKNFNFLVTEDGLKFAREKSSELKQKADTLDELRKDKIEEMSAPIVAFDLEAKELVHDILNVRNTITLQIKKLQQVEFEKLEALLKKELNTLWQVHAISKEFQKATFGELIQLGYLTQGGRLTKKANDSLCEKVLADKQRQDEINGRLLTLEGSCLKAGLKAPLSRHNVEHFLFAKEEVYVDRLKGLIAAELKRQEELEVRITAQAEERAQRAIEVVKTEAKAEKKVIENKATMQLSTPSPINNIPIPNGEAEYTITVTMKMRMKDIDIAVLQRKTSARLLECGFTSVANVEVVKSVALKEETNKTFQLMEGSLF